MAFIQEHWRFISEFGMSRVAWPALPSPSPVPFSLSFSHPPSLHPSSPLRPLYHREIERPLSPRDDDRQHGDGSEDGAGGFRDRHPGHIFAVGRERIDTNATERDTRPSHRLGVATNSSGSAYAPSEEDDGFDYDDSEGNVEDDDDEAEVFGPGYGSGGGERGSYRGDGSDGEYGGEGSGGVGEGSGVGGSVENFSLSGDSSEWTPLRGADLASPSPRRDRSEDWFSGSASPRKVWPVFRGCRFE